MRIKDTIIGLMMFLGAVTAQAQITIGGNVYGGGNAGDMNGKTSVTVRAGDINGSVYGGARQANVGGHTFVNIDGENMSGDILINYVYGGNDIAGTIGTSVLPTKTVQKINQATNEITYEEVPLLKKAEENGIDDSYNSLVLTTKEKMVGSTQPYKIYIGQVFGGGNGDYDYTSQTSEFYGMVKPELRKAYLEIRGGSIVILYGGGNNATVTEATDICIDNESAITYDMKDAQGNTKLTDDRLKAMGIYALGSAGENVATSNAYQFSRVFGGNNKAPMDIRPKWHLNSGKIRNLYSGGNRGAMTYEKGIFLPVTSDALKINNVYGGCRMADVNPGKAIDEETIEGVLCPAGYAARVHIGGGTINNVYGGNDISGMIYGGSAVGIHSSVNGHVFGGGNGSYPYTDNKQLKTSDLYGDYFYDVNQILGHDDDVVFTGQESAEALYQFRPNTEAVSVRLIGTEAKPTYIGGSVYCGGNSATLRSTSSTARAELKIGANVFANQVFMGSNGENMLTEKVLERLAKHVDEEGNTTDNTTDADFSQMNLLDATQFATYMRGCEMDIKPRVVFDPDYVNKKTYFGSFFCGGNRGSVNTEGMNTIDFNYGVIIYDKLVGGSNNAYIKPTQYNAAYNGGIIGSPDSAPDGKIGNKLTLNLSGLEIRPMRWKTDSYGNLMLKDGKPQLEWNVYTNLGVKSGTPTTIGATDTSGGNTTTDDLNRRLVGGNIYGGCYNSGHVNGNVIININASLVDTNVLFDKVTLDANGEEKLFASDELHPGNDKYFIEERRTGVIRGQQGIDVLGKGLNVFGGGKGRDTEIWGSTTINLNEKSYVFQIFGGSEEGIIGEATGTSTELDGTYANGVYSFNGKSYQYNPNYSCYVNLRGAKEGVPKSATSSEEMADCEYIYGGGFLGPICGNTVINLGKGRVYQTFGGSCNADILGHTETYVGRQVNADGSFTEGFPYVRDYIYGGNDLGGRILNKADFTSRIRQGVSGLALPGINAAKEVSAYTEYTQGHLVGIYAGCYGTYDYTELQFRKFFDEHGIARVTDSAIYTKPRMDNAFLNFRPTATALLKNNANNTVTKLYGAGQGSPGDADRDIMQDRSYILVDIPQDMENYKQLEVFGAGAWSGLGMREYVAPIATPNATEKAALDKVSAIIDLPRGQINAVYGASYQEGFTRRTEVNVPEKSTISLNKLFGGAYGLSNDTICDAYETNVNWNSSDALVGYIFGGNNNARRTLYGRVNINAPVWTNKTSGYMASVFGAGCGEDTWSQYTEVNFNKGAQAYIIYGGGQNGRVCNVATARQMSIEEYNDTEFKGLSIGNTYEEDGLKNPLAKPRHDGRKYNTNVIINKGSVVGSYSGGYQVGGGYAYGGGMGTVGKNRSGDVNGTTYIALLGGLVEKDLVAAGSVGSVFDRYGNLTDDYGNAFEASTTAYIAAGIARNVFGGGYKGSVGKHKTTEPLLDKDGNPMKDSQGNNMMIEVDADLNASTAGDIPAQANIIIGIRKDQKADSLKKAMKYLKDEAATNGYDSDTENNYQYGYYNGVPAIQRNVYGGGEGETEKGGRGGAIYGTANVTLNNGYIGYDYINGDFIEKLNDETWTVSDSIGRLKDYGNIFGGGYSDKSNVDETNVVMWGGVVRGSVHGGAEIAAIGRGETTESGEVNHIRTFGKITKPGKTHVTMYNGHVKRNVFGGGKGYNVLGFGGSNDLYTDGYVFGQTEVYIHGGEIGTAEAVKEGKNYGNVFGGGDLGYVYSKGFDNPKTKADKQAGITTGSPQHYYYYYRDNGEDKLIEDCKVVVEPYLQVKADHVTINGKTKYQYDYVETNDLNTLPKDKSAWAGLFTGDKDANGNPVPGDTEERGVLIHNAVFGGGNVSSNSDTHYANATTVFGNTTATLYDCYHRDFITVGTEHTGGLYGGGNLSKSDGYRELNITNYGTDYYGLSSRITLEEYRNLSNREHAYFQLEYVCKDGTETHEVEGVTKYGVYIDDDFYENGQRVKEEDFEKLKKSSGFNAANWEQFGFCSIYAGRLLNTIQRADFCAVFGSRMVLQGAKDRVAEVGEDIDYTINRVGELSLNKQRSVRTVAAGYTGSDPDTGSEALHGNYFGIYSIVNYLGNLTSDVAFGDNYVDSNGNPVTDLTTNQPYTYYSFKKSRPTGNDRNYGESPNQVALASGVFLELTTELTELNPNKEKDYGLITGVVELDLINVKRATEGGGFVYAKNEHRVPRFYPNKKNVVLSEYNKPRIVNGEEVRDDARTYKQYRYSEDQEGDWSSTGDYIISGDVEENAYKPQLIETSGNFIHPSDKRIIDDCYPTNNAYIIGVDPYSKAHYWYVKGSVYVYKQVVSAYTGSANAYSKDVRLPLTITAASNGRLKLLDVKPNLYAYYFEEGKKIGTEGNDGSAWVNNNADRYHLNDVITWWDWNHLSVSDKKLFVTETVVNSRSCKIDGQDYSIGEYVMLPTDVSSFKADNHTITDLEGHPFVDIHGHPMSNSDVVDDVFRTSNNIGHDTGYVLTFDMDTPKIWNDWYSPVTGNSTYTVNGNTVSTTRKTKEEYDALSPESKSDWVEGPTFSPQTTAVYGRRDYSEGDIITKAVYDHTDDGKEHMKEAYVASENISYTYQGQNKTVNAGTAIPSSEYEALTTEQKSYFGKAWVCIGSLKLAEEDYLLNGDLLTASQIEALKTKYQNVIDGEEIDAIMTEAYICTLTGKYGGLTYEANMNYSAKDSWCSLSEDDREHFDFNHDALDLFADPNYLGFYNPSEKKTTEQAYRAPYSNQVPVEYNAVYNSDAPQTLMFTDGTTREFTYNTPGAVLTSGEFERIRNDKRYYTRIETGTTDTDAYVAIDNFTDAQGTPYGKGQVVDADVYSAHAGKVNKVTGLTPNSTTYYCFEAHQEGDNTISVGDRIDESRYKNDLIDHQKFFTIQGQEPTETTTLFVNRESDIRDLTKEKVVTVVYQYTYYENGDNGDVKMTNELHVVNIHLQLESGAPSIGTLNEPPIVLPGSAVGLDRPEVRAGIYEVLINGWELYSDKNDADHHRNGVPFTNNKTPVYWYQNNDHYIAFYSKTYLGKTYSNSVPVRVANYHDLGEVMERYKDNHLYIDRADVDRPAKVYINDYTTVSDDDPRKDKNGLDELKNLFDLSLLTPSEDELDEDGLIKTGTFQGHAPLGSHIRGAQNLEFILRTDIDGSVPDGSPARQAIAPVTGETCFGGNMHGDGHQITGLTNSLFGKLCGNVYNLGVTGSFTSAGVADEGDGFVENCWVKTSATSLPANAEKVNAVFGNPSDPTNPNCVQVVNCYYPESNAALYAGGQARKMADKAFYDGEVAYNLNGFYLCKRYYDGIHLGTGQAYEYFPAHVDGTLPTNTEGTKNVTSTAYYPGSYAYYTPQGVPLKQGVTQAPKMGYVEQRYYDGDFRYAAGQIPEGYNIRRRESEDIDEYGNPIVAWAPIWPDDYLFFGQTLSYGYVDGRLHQTLPSVINKYDERLLTTDANNRVYRAPAYFRSSKMRMAHFNPNAVFAETMNGDAAKVAYKDMTAIDFTGYGDVSNGYQIEWTTAAPYNHVEGGVFYPPLLDDGGLTAFQNVNLTKNLLVYTEAESDAAQLMPAQKTANVVSAKLHDYDYIETDADYKTVAEWDYTSNYEGMHGHWVYKSGTDYIASLDHFLLDKHDFNAPIAYQFDDSHRMWYQRKPDMFVDRTKGWEGVSLPFTADIVTTNTKGEITHFYSGSNSEDETTKTKVGHEYWLRELKDGGTLSDDQKVYTANFEYPSSVSTDPDKEVTNTFLWDFYYKADYDRQDANSDLYQTYYSNTREYEKYARLTSGKPYIIGFPGATYYEFDLSGTFIPANTAPGSSKELKKQVITFASAIGAEISVSDEETVKTQGGDEAGVTEDGFTFKSTYLNNPEIAEGRDVFLMDADGSSFDKTAPGEVTIAAFRPYFTKPATAGSRARKVEQIVFSQTNSKFGVDDQDPRDDEYSGTLNIFTRRHKIVVESTLKQTVDVNIITPAGVTLNTVTVEPGQTVETRMTNRGVYLVQSADGRHKKKLAVR